MFKPKNYRKTYLNLDVMLGAGGLGILETLANLRHLQILSDIIIRQQCMVSIYLIEYSSPSISIKHS